MVAKQSIYKTARNLMKIQITSYVQGLSNSNRLELTIETINNSTADILLFSGHTIGFVNEIEQLQTSLKNNKTEVIFELESINSDTIRNCLYHIKNGKIKSLYTNQIFTQSVEIENNHEHGDRLLHEFESKRKIIIKGLSVLIIQCGEINILKNIQSENNKVEFRLLDNQFLKKRFNKLLSETDIFFNPIHTPMGNQGKILKRREFLSKNKRYYFSACNTKKGSNNLELKSLQYAFFNENELCEIEKIENVNSVSRVFNIETESK